MSEQGLVQSADLGIAQRPRDSEWIDPTVHNLPSKSRLPLLLLLPLPALSYFGQSRELGTLAVISAMYDLILIIYLAYLNGARLPFSKPRPKNKTEGDFTPELLNERVVNLAIYVNRKLIGRDQGVLGFQNDALYFAGTSSSFLLGRQDFNLNHSFQSFSQIGEGKLVIPNRGFVLTLRHPDVKLELVCYYPVRPNRIRLPIDLETTEIEDTLTRKPHTHQPRSFPPITKPVVRARR